MPWEAWTATRHSMSRRHWARTASPHVGGCPVHPDSTIERTVAPMAARQLASSSRIPPPPRVRSRRRHCCRFDSLVAPLRIAEQPQPPIHSDSRASYGWAATASDARLVTLSEEPARPVSDLASRWTWVCTGDLLITYDEGTPLGIRFAPDLAHEPWVDLVIEIAAVPADEDGITSSHTTHASLTAWLGAVRPAHRAAGVEW